MLTLIYEEAGRAVRTGEAARLPALLADQQRCFWLDLEVPTGEEFDLLVNVFQFHPLAVEDARHTHQRPKLDEFEGYFFLTADEVTLEGDVGKDGTPPGDGAAIRKRQRFSYNVRRSR